MSSLSQGQLPPDKRRRLRQRDYILSFEWMNRQWYAALTLAIWAAMSVALMVLAPGLPGWADLAIGLVPAVLVALPLNGIRKAALKRHTSEEQWSVEVRPEGQWVSDKMVDRYRHVLADGEDCIHLITRLHAAKLAANAAHIVTLLTASLLLVLGVGVAVVGYMPWWTALPVIAVFALIAWFQTIELRYTVFILTGVSAWKVFRPPVFLAPFLPGFQLVDRLDAIQTWDKEESRIANFLGMDYATLVLDTPSTHDAWANNLRFMKHPERVMLLVGSLIQAAKQRRLESVGTP